MGTQLAELTKETAMSAFTSEKGLDSYVEQVKEEVNNFDHDLSTAAGRAKTISLASKVAKIKVKYDNCGKDLVSDWKANALKVDKARKKMRDELDELKILARKPVTDWEEEQVKIEAEKQLKLEAEMLAKEIANDEDLAILMDEKFDRDLADEKARIEEEAKKETARLAQEKIDNDIRIAKEATIEAERLAQEKIDNAKIAEQKAIDDKAQADADLLASQAREKLLNEQANQTRLNNEWLAYITEAYQINDKLNADVEAETNRLTAIETERLAGIERQRVADEKAKAAQDKLEADTKHVGSVRGEIKNHLMSTCGLDNKLATKVVKALLHIDRVTINY